jgi:hypothetical protein
MPPRRAGGQSLHPIYALTPWRVNPIGIEEVSDGCWRVWFSFVPLGWLDVRWPGRMHRHFRNQNLLPISSV